MLRDEDAMRLAESAAKFGTCDRRQIGCAMLDCLGEALSTGYNGPACGDCLCPGASVPAGTGNAECYGIHAEMRALFAAGPNDDRIHACYCTKAPCTACVLALLGTNCRHIYFRTASNETRNRELWERAGRGWHHLPKEQQS